jgi:hypothetical protein
MKAGTANNSAPKDDQSASTLKVKKHQALIGSKDLDIESIIEDVDMFRHALSKAKITKQGWLELSPELYDYLLDGREHSESHDYENVKLYRGPIKDKVDREGMLNVDDWATLKAKQAKEKNDETREK